MASAVWQIKIKAFRKDQIGRDRPCPTPASLEGQSATLASPACGRNEPHGVQCDHLPEEVHSLRMKRIFVELNPTEI